MCRYLITYSLWALVLRYLFKPRKVAATCLGGAGNVRYWRNQFKNHVPPIPPISTNLSFEPRTKTMLDSHKFVSWGRVLKVGQIAEIAVLDTCAGQVANGKVFVFSAFLMPVAFPISTARWRVEKMSTRMSKGALLFPHWEFDDVARVIHWVLVFQGVNC